LCSRIAIFAGKIVIQQIDHLLTAGDWSGCFHGGWWLPQPSLSIWRMDVLNCSPPFRLRARTGPFDMLQIVLPWLLVLAFAIVGMGLETCLPKPQFLRAGVRRIQTFAFRMPSATRAGLLGFATPLLPCGPLYLMFALAMANGSALKGAEFAFAFGLGTLPLLWIAQTQLHVISGRVQPQTLRRIQRTLAFTAAVIMPWRLRGTLDFGSEAVPSCCHAVM